jgi:alcohol dehydrogenase class IV
VASLPGAGLFADVRGNPVAANVEAGLKAYRGGDHDGVVAFGGGSGLDAGKVIAFMSGQTRPLWDFEDVGDWWTRADPAGIAPVVAVPTTAGTGSEVGRAGVILNEETHQKKIIFHPKMMPGIVIADPNSRSACRRRSLPPRASTRSYIASRRSAHRAFIRSPTAWRSKACGSSRPIYPAPRVMVATWRRARACWPRPAWARRPFRRGSGPYMRSRIRWVRSFDTHHGLTNAVITPYVIVHNRDAIADRMKVVARVLDLPKPGVEGVLAWVLEFRKELGIPHSLAEIGVTLRNPEEIGREAAIDPSAGGNPIPVDASTLERIFRSAVKGDLSLKS